jgi:glycosyltransferase involved in cell wall biosynthesis
LLEAFQKTLLQEEAELWILGEGSERPKIEAQIERLNIEENVSLFGFRENPFKFMAAADIFVLPSLWEGFGNVIAEAMACGTPVVSTDCPHGPGEIITHGENGLLVPPANPDALSKALLQLLEDQDLRRELSKNGERRAQDFHVSEIGRQYLDLFREVIGRHN